MSGVLATNGTRWPDVRTGRHSRRPTARTLFRESPMANVSSLLARAGLVALAISIAGAVGPAFANSSGGSSGGSSTPSCPTGYVYDKNKQACVKSSSMNDEQLYQQGRDLALGGRYE